MTMPSEGDGDFYGDFGDPYGPGLPSTELGVDFYFAWVQDGRAAFPLIDALNAPFGIEAWEETGLSVSIPSSLSPGMDGEYNEDGTAEAATITLTGRLIAPDRDTLRAQKDALYAALRRGTPGRLYRNSDRYISGRVYFLRPGDKDDGFNHFPWVLGLKCNDPCYYDTLAQDAVPLTVTGTGGTTALIPGGSAEALPLITLTVPVGGVGKTITLTSPGNSLSCIFVPPSAGTYYLDSAEGTITKSGAPNVDYLYALTGDLLSLHYYATSITTLLSEAGILTSGSVQWTRRWRSG